MNCTSENNKNNGEIYHCHDLDCPMHGERNRQYAMGRFPTRTTDSSRKDIGMGRTGENTQSGELRREG